MKLKITVGICVRNCASTLRETIESIAVQDYPHELMEIIFVDDGSTDNTLSIIRDYALKLNTKVKIFHHEWKGLGYSRNVVVDNAEGEYIIWVDGDMVLPRDFVRKQVEFMEKNPDVGIAKARHGIMSTENVIAILENVPFVIYDYNSKNKKNNLLKKLPGTGGAIFRLEALRQVSGFDGKIKGAGEDQDAAFRIKKAGWAIKQSPTIFFEKRPQTWIAVWRKWFWYGFSNYEIYRKNRNIFSLLVMNPVASFIKGLLYISIANKLLHKKLVLLLLPFAQTFEMLAWCVGFICGMVKR